MNNKLYKSTNSSLSTKLFIRYRSYRRLWIYSFGTVFVVSICKQILPFESVSEHELLLEPADRNNSNSNTDAADKNLLKSSEIKSRSTEQLRKEDIRQNATKLPGEGHRHKTTGQTHPPPSLESHEVIHTKEDERISNWNIGRIEPHEYTIWPSNMSLPCLPPEKDWYKEDVFKKPTREGFLFFKPYKTGSSTTAGINLRIAQNVAKRSDQYEICKCRFDHGDVSSLYKNRIRDRSYLWTILRDPTKRAISAFFHFGVARSEMEPTDTNFQKFIMQDYMKDNYIKSMYRRPGFDRYKTDPLSAIQQIVNYFDFIGTTERMDESAVVLMMLLNLPMSDILYLSAKKSGGYDAGRGVGDCRKITPSFVTPGMEEFFRSPKWQSVIRYDTILYKVVNQSLDVTIDRLGRDVVARNVKKYREAVTYANKVCIPRVIFPCDDTGYHPRTKLIVYGKIVRVVAPV